MTVLTGWGIYIIISIVGNRRPHSAICSIRAASPLASYPTTSHHNGRHGNCAKRQSPDKKQPALQAIGPIPANTAAKTRRVTNCGLKQGSQNPATRVSGLCAKLTVGRRLVSIYSQAWNCMQASTRHLQRSTPGRCVAILVAMAQSQLPTVAAETEQAQEQLSAQNSPRG